eukprot:g70664.t1
MKKGRRKGEKVGAKRNATKARAEGLVPTEKWLRNLIIQFTLHCGMIKKVTLQHSELNKIFCEFGCNPSGKG